MRIIISSSSLQGEVDSRDPSLEQPIICPKLRPDITSFNTELFTSSDFKDLVALRLSAAVKIPTVTYDGMEKVGIDPRWDIFYSFTKYLRNTFPALYAKLGVTTINEHGLLYTWQGSDTQLKPLLFMAHYDVVPAPDSTLDRWTYPPFSGHYDGEFVWGRGSQDDKSNLIAILSSIDTLLSRGFEPTRTVLVSVGFDEEGGANQSFGARCLASHIFQIYGEDGIEMIFDEGMATIEKHFGTEFALPATAEKGYIDVRVTIETAGGHSSTPPDHTAIGYLAQAIQAIEANPFKPRLTDKNPTREYLRSIALYSKDMPSSLRNEILNSPSSDKVIKYMDSSLETRALVRTSTAVDVVYGGEKANALPETAYALVNHRIAVEESVQVLKEHYAHALSPLANKWNFKLSIFGKEIYFHDTASGKVTLTSHGDLEPSPVSNHKDVRFSWLAGALRGVFGGDIYVAPALLTGNTDTKFFWKLSSQIYRMSPWRASLDPRGTKIHTVDERMPVEGLLEMIRFYHELIRVLDEKRR